MISRLLLILFISLGCNKKYDQAACDDLSMKKFKGFTDASKKLEDNCEGFEIKYTPELCQSAFNDLVISTSLTQVKQKYGDPVETCFTEQDLKKFNKN